MAYRPNPDQGGRERDYAYPSEIAGQRPLLAPRIQCVPEYEDREPENTLRGRVEDEAPHPPPMPEPEPLDDRVAIFNRQLREGR
jgi:hypothetical protein